MFGVLEDAGRFGIFHLLAGVSIASLATALVILRLWRHAPAARIAHGHIMLWSFAGLVAAGLGQGATLQGLSSWPSILIAFAVTGVIALRIDLVAMAGAR